LNKLDLVMQCLRYTRQSVDEAPATWEALKMRLLGFETSIGWDAPTIARVRVRLHAECFSLIAFRDVEDALTTYGVVRTGLAMRDKLVGASREAARRASVRFRESEGQYLGVLDAERSLYNAKATLVAAR
jgi:hypothetical protein